MLKLSFLVNLQQVDLHSSANDVQNMESIPGKSGNGQAGLSSEEEPKGRRESSPLPRKSVSSELMQRQ
jgi:hypothetical protein